MADEYVPVFLKSTDIKSYYFKIKKTEDNKKWIYTFIKIHNG